MANVDIVHGIKVKPRSIEIAKPDRRFLFQFFRQATSERLTSLRLNPVLCAFHPERTASNALGIGWIFKGQWRAESPHSPRQRPSVAYEAVNFSFTGTFSETSFETSESFPETMPFHFCEHLVRRLK
jgi:hypothetical protein